MPATYRPTPFEYRQTCSAGWALKVTRVVPTPMIPDLTPTAWEALDELYQAKIEGSPPIRIISAVSAELQGSGLAIELPDGTLEITLYGSQSWEERQRLGKS